MTLRHLLALLPNEPEDFQGRVQVLTGRGISNCRFDTCFCRVDVAPCDLEQTVGPNILVLTSMKKIPQNWGLLYLLPQQSLLLMRLLAKCEVKLKRSD